MGCASSVDAAGGHSTAKQPPKKTTSLRSSESAYVTREGPSNEDAHETTPDDEDEDEMNSEQLQLMSEMDKRSTVSTAVTTDEPSNFALQVKVGVKCVKARILHGIDGSCESADELSDAEDARRRRQCKDRDRPLRMYGDLKPRQVRKIQEWVQRVFELNGSNNVYEPVPERYPKMANFGASTTDTNSPPGSPLFPETPHRIASRTGDDMSSSGPLTFRYFDVSVSADDEGAVGVTPRQAPPGYVDFDDGGNSPRLGCLPGENDAERVW